MKVKSMIRIRIRRVWICNTGLKTIPHPAPHPRTIFFSFQQTPKFIPCTSFFSFIFALFFIYFTILTPVSPLSLVFFLFPSHFSLPLFHLFSPSEIGWYSIRGGGGIFQSIYPWLISSPFYIYPPKALADWQGFTFFYRSPVRWSADTKSIAGWTSSSTTTCPRIRTPTSTVWPEQGDLALRYTVYFAPRVFMYT